MAKAQVLQELVTATLSRFHTMLPTRNTLDQPDGDDLLRATAAQAWRLQLELAWSHPRLCYAVWSRLMTMPSLPDADR